MSTSDEPKTYRELVQRTLPPSKPPVRGPEDELDSLITTLTEQRKQAPERAGAFGNDPIRALRELMINELIPTFVELVEKYSKSGISMQMDASNFLEGGREIRFEFGIGEFRTQLMGTVTTEAIAFHETRHLPGVRGELVSGPMLRLRHLTTQTFRQFICERLTVLLRSATRKH